MIDKIRIEKGLYWDEAWSLVSGCAPVSGGSPVTTPGEAKITVGGHLQKLPNRKSPGI